MMVFNIFAQLSKVTGLPPIVLICALVIILFLIIFGILILIKVRNIIRALNNVNNSLDSIVQRIGNQPGKSERKASYGNKWESAVNTDRKLADNDKPRHNPRKLATKIFDKNELKNKLGDKAADSPENIETKNSRNVPQKRRSEERAINQEISAKIYDLLKKSGKPTPYHDLTKHLSKDYPGYDYDYFLNEAEGLQKEGKVEVQLVAGKLYFQIKEP